MTAFFVVLGLAMLALLLVQAAAAFARPDAREARRTHPEVAPCDQPRRPQHISRSAAGPRSITYALRAPGPLCERVFAFISRHGLQSALAFATPPVRAHPSARVVPAPG